MGSPTDPGPALDDVVHRRIPFNNRRRPGLFHFHVAEGDKKLELDQLPWREPEPPFRLMPNSLALFRLSGDLKGLDEVHVMLVDLNHRTSSESWVIQRAPVGGEKETDFFLIDVAKVIELAETDPELAEYIEETAHWHLYVGAEGRVLDWVDLEIVFQKDHPALRKFKFV